MQSSESGSSFTFPSSTRRVRASSAPTTNESIPLGARIFAVVDSLDAMTDTRPYREPVGWDEAVEEIRRCAGAQFDPDVVYGFEACEPDLYRLHAETAEIAA